MEASCLSTAVLWLTIHDEKELSRPLGKYRNVHASGRRGETYDTREVGLRPSDMHHYKGDELRSVICLSLYPISCFSSLGAPFRQG